MVCLVEVVEHADGNVNGSKKSLEVNDTTSSLNGKTALAFPSPRMNSPRISPRGDSIILTPNHTQIHTKHTHTHTHTSLTHTHTHTH